MLHTGTATSESIADGLIMNVFGVRFFARRAKNFGDDFQKKIPGWGKSKKKTLHSTIGVPTLGKGEDKLPTSVDSSLRP